MLQNEEMAAFLKAEIHENGSMDMATFMEHVLAHPTLGYYRRQDPFGEFGDFVTSPEISQLFGEMLGAWAADLWVQMDSPAAFDFIEVGPGRGTLMVDMLRATKGVKGFHEAAHIHLVETSPVLREKQKKTLKGYIVHWHERFETVGGDRPFILIGNEFLDALPVHQLVKAGNSWKERVVLVADEDKQKKVEGAKSLLESLAPNLLKNEHRVSFVYGEQEASDSLLKLVPENVPAAPDGNIYEVSPQRDGFVRKVARRLKADEGAALFIDYGSVEPEIGDSVHAIFRHSHVDVLKNPGHADLSANVDFYAVARAAEKEGAIATPAVKQGAFLKALGIEARVDYLLGRANQKQAEDLQSGLHRLTDLDQMGNFLVMGIYNDASLKPAGF